MLIKALLVLVAAVTLSVGGSRGARAADESPPAAPKTDKSAKPDKPVKSKAKAKGTGDKAGGATEVTATEVTLKGDMTCAKCGLHEGSVCQNVLRVKEGDKEVKYYLTKNAVAEENHEKVCGGSSPATVTGTLGTEGAKKTITPSAVKFD